MILQKIQQVETMVQHLFELSKMEAAEFKPLKEPFILSEIVQEIINTFSLAAAEKDICLRCAQCQYHVWVNADIGMIERVVQNLIDNALKSTPAGGNIEISIIPDDKKLIFSIANTGNPLPEDLLQWINDSKDDTNVLNKRPSKLGLGLLIVQKSFYCITVPWKPLLMRVPEIYLFFPCLSIIRAQTIKNKIVILL